MPPFTEGLALIQWKDAFPHWFLLRRIPVPELHFNRILQKAVKKSLRKLFVQIAFIKAARLQNEIAPEKLLNRYEKRFEKREKKDPKNDPKRVWNIFSPSQAA